MYPWLPNSVILGLLYHGQQFKDLKECRNAMGSNCNAVESFQMALWTKDKWTIHTYFHNSAYDKMPGVGLTVSGRFMV